MTLKDLKTGDTVWSSRLGYIKVLNIWEIGDYPIKTEAGSFDYEGKQYNTDNLPTLFLINPFEAKKMLVSMDEKYWTEKDVILQDNKIFVESNWKFAKEIEQETEITLEQIAEKFNIPIDKIRIKK